MGLYQIYHPEVFQGRNKKREYFESWYYKQVSEDHSQVLAIIPSISERKQTLNYACKQAFPFKYSS